MVELTTQERLTLSIDNDTSPEKSFGMSINAMRLVCNIVPSGLAYEAGVRMGDVLLAFNDQQVQSEEFLFEQMRHTLRARFFPSGVTHAGYKEI
ncbi:hypothetical protein EMIHUDRAFT_242958 [Emiliania huxleyi CCMP1516]|uniref:PDZ domain-containing protein n=2 Tax=Emiliania huxleyi TaxID=2903 RepID=A0A0D3J752_EMIH1|nr:hypothetical protein EMIHUDRAFT_242958 [Emiliania huxleyi CCMP1516]EOD19337.1 hypothetical protein EMIHUDRAFT_242958 [Emiliania huxleyi CCMP1516]|eukprot:XP_005771766.1 hypothetical protein EMIHUDRAFT_242958 [Emiliania huxleyi CCMP1516]